MSKRYNRTIAAVAALAQEIEEISEITSTIGTTEMALALRKIIADSRDKVRAQSPNGSAVWDDGDEDRHDMNAMNPEDE